MAHTARAEPRLEHEGRRLRPSIANEPVEYVDRHLMNHAADDVAGGDEVPAAEGVVHAREQRVADLFGGPKLSESTVYSVSYFTTRRRLAGTEAATWVASRSE